MTQTQFSISVEISAPPHLVWPMMTDIERWPEWTPSVSRVKLLTAGPLRVGSRARIHQPKFPPAYWRVTELDPERQFTWVSVGPGLRVTARHAVEPVNTGCRVTLSIRYEGFLGRWLARLTRGLIERYLAMEGNGLKARCTFLAKSTD